MFEGAIESRPQLETQLRTRQIHNVAAHGAAGGHEKAPGVFREVNGVVAFVHQNRRRRHRSIRRRCNAASLSASAGLVAVPDERNVAAPGNEIGQTRQRTRLDAGDRRRLINVARPVDATKQACRTVRGFRGAEKQKSVGVERVVEHAAHLRLQVVIEIDEHVAAGDQIDP